MPSKLGPHFQKIPTSFNKWVESGTAVFKFAEGQGAANDLPASVLAIGRRNQMAPADWKALKNQGKSPSEVAQIRFAHNQQEYTHPNNQRIDVWEDDNEVVPDNEEEAKWYAQYSIDMMKHYESIGKKRAIFSFAVGTPSKKEIWEFLLPAVRYAHDNGHYIALHEYMAYEADLGVGRNQVKDGKKWNGYFHGRHDANNNPIEDYPYGWGVLRYRMIWDEYLRPAGLGNTPLLITEAGCDLISFTPEGMPTGSWVSFKDAWSAEGKVPEAHFANMLKWYDSELRKDAFVKGALIFTVGASGHWDGFEIAGTAVEDQICAYIAQERNQPDKLFGGGVSMITQTNGQSATEPTPLNYIPFDSPVGTAVERRSDKIYPGGWIDVNPFKNKYINPSTNKEWHHTGNDLNMAGDGDRDAPVYAAADGVVTCVQHFNVWGNVIVIKHDDNLFSRYGHVTKMDVTEGQQVKRGQKLAHVGQDALGGPFHLHFDISHSDILETVPNHWPHNLAELEPHYIDPEEYIRTHRPANVGQTNGSSTKTGTVNAKDGLNLRSEPSSAQGDVTVIQGLNWGSTVIILEKLGDWLRVRAGGVEGYVFAKFITINNATILDLSSGNSHNSGTEAHRATGNGATSNGQGTMFDLLSYLQGDGRAYMVRSQQTGNQELIFSAQENGRFYTCKGEYHFGSQGVVCNWEEMWEENGFIMRGTDTSPDEERYYVQRENGKHGSRWVRRNMKIGDSTASNPHVQFYTKKSNDKVDQNSGPAHNTITLLAHHDSITFFTGITCQDVIELKWDQGGEVYYYMKNVGLVGWKGLHDGHTQTFNAVSEWLDKNRQKPKRLQLQIAVA